MYKRQRRRLAHPTEIRVRPTNAQGEAFRAAAEAVGLSVEAWLIEAGELALVRGGTR